jgi:hypothetical protein
VHEESEEGQRRIQEDEAPLSQPALAQQELAKAIVP